jgi:hypothetical protein
LPVSVPDVFKPAASIATISRAIRDE